MSAAQRRVNELSSRVSELEEALSRTQRELARASENNAKLQRDLRENAAQKVDQVKSEKRVYVIRLLPPSIRPFFLPPIYATRNTNSLCPSRHLCFRHNITFIPNMTGAELEIMQFELWLCVLCMYMLEDETWNLLAPFLLLPCSHTSSQCVVWCQW